MKVAIRSIFDYFLANKVFRYLFSGGISALVDIVIFKICLDYILKVNTVNFLGIELKAYSLALTISYTAGSLTSFFMNKYFVFGMQNQGFSQFWKALPVYLIAFGGNWILLKFFIEISHLDMLVGRVLAALLVAFITFNLHKYFTFKRNAKLHHD